MAINPLDMIALQASARPTLSADPEGGQLTQDNAAAKAYYDEISAIPGTPGYERKQAELRRQAAMNGGTEEINSQKRDEALAAQNGLVLPEGYTVATEPVLLAVAPAPATKRVAIYHGKNDTYNVAVESAPEWDTETMFKQMDEGQVTVIVHLATALGVKISDKTGDF